MEFTGSIGVIVFTYNRIDMLTRTLASLYYNVDDILILDDCSDYKLEGDNVLQNKVNGGKYNFWQQWQVAFDWVRLTDYDYYIFMPDDFTNMDCDRLLSTYKELDKEYGSVVLNLINDGRVQEWRAFKPKHYDNYVNIGFTDCGFMTSRDVIQKLEFYIKPVSVEWFRVANSSGVGSQLTKRMSKAGVNFFKPVKSFCYHGEHDSVMHPEERIKNPLVSL